MLRVEYRDFHFKKNDSVGRFTVVSMKNWAVIVPVTAEGNLILVRQFRVGTLETLYEFPGGALEDGEDEAAGALRELEEETGYKGALTELCRMRPNPAFMDNFCWLYMASDCVRTSELSLDPFEDLEPVEFTPDEVERMILDGRIVHSISIAAYGAYIAYLKTK